MPSRSFPAWPTKGRPVASSVAPGPSPTSTSRACGLPSPGTALVRLGQSAAAVTWCGSARRPHRASGSVGQVVAQRATGSAVVTVSPGPGIGGRALQPRGARAAAGQLRSDGGLRSGVGHCLPPRPRLPLAAARRVPPPPRPAPSAVADTAAAASAKGLAPPRPEWRRPPRASIAAAGSAACPSRPSIATRLVSCSKPAPGSSASLTTMRSRSLRSSFARPFASASPVSSAKPTMTLPCFRLALGGTQDVLRGLHRDRQRAVHPGALARRSGCWAGSRPAPRPSPARRLRAARRAPPPRDRWCSRPVTQRDTDRGAQRDRSRDQHDVGAALPGGLGHPVTHLAAGAVGDHPHRIDGLAGRPRGHHDAAAAELPCRAAGGRRGPGSSPARSFGPGAPRGPRRARRSPGRRWRRLACAGARGWPGSAGRRTSRRSSRGRAARGAVRASSSVVRTSSARPWATRAMRWAVAGATMTRSASCPSRTCESAPPGSQREVRTGRPVSASNVSGRTNSAAPSCEDRRPPALPPRPGGGRGCSSCSTRSRPTRRERRAGRPTRSGLGAAAADQLVVQVPVDQRLERLGGELLGLCC